MKRLILLLYFLGIGSYANAQLANTKWTGTLAVPDLMSAILNFKTDTMEVIASESGEFLETMSYTISGDTLLLKKVSGGSPCPVGSTFKVKFALQHENLMVTPLSDDCAMRSESWTKDPFVKVKE
jgi:hypothetical protein